MDNAREVCTRLMAELSKADITFERLAEAASIRRTPKRKSKPVNLASCVTGVVNSLPERDQHHIQLPIPTEPVLVQGDEARLAFVVRSILDYMLSTRPIDGTHIAVMLGSVERDRYQGLVAELEFKLVTATQTDDSDSPDSPGDRCTNDPLQFVFDAARDDARLALPTIREVIRAHGGFFATGPRNTSDADSSKPLTSFKMQLPQL